MTRLEFLQIIGKANNGTTLLGVTDDFESWIPAEWPKYESGQWVSRASYSPVDEPRRRGKGCPELPASHYYWMRNQITVEIPRHLTADWGMGPDHQWIVHTAGGRGRDSWRWVLERPQEWNWHDMHDVPFGNILPKGLQSGART